MGIEKNIRRTIKGLRQKDKEKCPRSPLNEIQKYITKHESGIITAFWLTKNLGEIKNIAKENEKRNAELKARLLVGGYGIAAVKGIFIENYGTDACLEINIKGFLVIDINDKRNLKQRLVKLGKKYEQDSVVFIKPSGEYYLISANKCPNAYSGKGRSGVELKLGRIMSGRKNELNLNACGGPFIIKSIQNRVKRLSDYSKSQINRLKYLADKEVIELRKKDMRQIAKELRSGPNFGKDRIFLSEAGFSRVIDKMNLEKNDFAVLSAWRRKDENGKPLTRDDNIKRNREMRDEFNKRKIGVYQLVGNWEEDGVLKYERSYLAVRPENISIDEFQEFILRQLEKFNQDATVLAKDGIIYLLHSPSGKLEKKGDKIVFGKISGIYSRYVKKMNIPFVFEAQVPRDESKSRVIMREYLKILFPPAIHNEMREVYL